MGPILCIIAMTWFTLFAKTENHVITNFSAIRVHGPINVYLAKNKGDTVSITADKDIIGNIIFSVVSDTLIIKSDKPIRHERILKIYMSSEKIRSVEMRGSGTLEVVDLITRDSLDILLSGSSEARVLINTNYLNINIKNASNIYMAGTTSKLNVSLNGVSDLIGYNLKSKVCILDVNGRDQSPGILRVSVSDSLTTSINGSRVVYYKGDPIVTTSIIGSGKVLKK
jgi:hypothetical protein